MQPGDIVRPVVTVKNATTGAVVTGLVTADFAVDYYLDATAPTAVFTVTEIGGGRYRPNLTLPGTAGWMNIFITSPGRIVENGRLQGDLEAQDLDSLFAVVGCRSRPAPASSLRKSLWL